MSGRRREGLAPNLFPFLAVLICTLGTLILLLALVAQNAGEAIAASTAAARTPEQDAEQRMLVEADAALDRRLGEARWHRDQVVGMRDEQTQEIDQRRTRQAHLEDHVRRLREELARIEAEVEAAQGTSQPSEQNAAAVDALKLKIADEKSKIEKLKDDLQTQAPRIVIVPHKGPNGTDRRPVYVECRADGVYLQPGNIAIDPKYLDNDIPGPNPLDAALRTIRTHAMKHYGDVDAPYPLIVVRPDGIETYGAARFAMKGWDDQYGYELVPEDIKLAYPEPDPVLNQQIEQAIAQAVNEQQRIARNGFSRGGRGGGAGSMPGRGLGDADSPTAAASRQAAAGQPSGNPAPRRAGDLPILSARNMDAAAQDALENGYRMSGTQRRSAASQRAATAAAANAAALEPSLTAETDALARSTGTAPRSQQGPGPANPSGPANEPGPTSQTGQANQEMDDPNASSYSALNPPQQNRETGGQDADPTSAINGDPLAPLSDVASRSRQLSVSTDPNAPIGGTQASGSTDTTNPAGSAPPPLDANSAAERQDQAAPPPAGVKLDAQGQKPPKSLVKRAGRNWALPPDVASTMGTAMVRTIRVECHEDRFVLLPEGGRGATNMYGFSDGNIDRASLEMATAIRDRVDRWGAAMPGGRWHPLLDVKVVPGGEVRYQQLRRLMDGSGVEIQAQGPAR